MTSDIRFIKGRRGNHTVYRLDAELYDANSHTETIESVVTYRQVIRGINPENWNDGHNFTKQDH